MSLIQGLTEDYNLVHSLSDSSEDQLQRHRGNLAYICFTVKEYKQSGINLGEIHFMLHVE